MKHLLSRFLLALILQSQLISAEDNDVGQIAYFEGPCPDGWTDYIKGQGRFIFGEGAGHILGSYGGESEHALTADEIPIHSHHMWSNSERTELASDSYSKQAGFVGEGGLPQDNPTLEYYIQGTFGPPTVGKTGTIGGGQQHNNMPPYITLRTCQKQILTKIDLSLYVKGSTLSQYTRVSDMTDFARSKDFSSHITDFQFEKQRLSSLEKKVNEVTCEEQKQIVLQVNIQVVELLAKYEGLLSNIQSLQKIFTTTIGDNALNLEDKFKQLKQLYDELGKQLKFSICLSNQQCILLLLYLLLSLLF